ncbi:hypothetical protein ABZ726_26605 [Streptomyces hundungensis]|uniref:TIGR02679 domain-containing protein n=1 Tax=Streptomyces hundungensis TaxID=1077946 RepID=UPI0034079538
MVLAAVPAQAEPLPVFAARVLKGESHALYDGTRSSTYVASARTALRSTFWPWCGGLFVGHHRDPVGDPRPLPLGSVVRNRARYAEGVTPK